MSSILLGSLAHSRSKSKKIELNYDSNMENKMNMIERQQVRQNHRKPEFLKQFDDLRLDNIDEPVGINESYKTIEGMNSSLQRNLDFVNGYSMFQETDMHYDVVNSDKFTHNNMVPNTSRRDFSINADRSQRKLEAFSGIDPLYVAKKEKVPLFQPMPDLTWINGMPVVTNELQKRYLPSSKNNFGNLPFENNVKVRPGLEFENQEGNYSVYRVNPRNVDALRSDINQKVTYENKPLETIKKGELRGPDPKLTKYKLPDYRETKFSDLVATKADIEGPKQTGKFTDVRTQRNETENYQPGPAINTNRGNGPDKSKTRFEPGKRESYYNDFTHATVDVNNKPVMTNAKSYKNYENQRVTTNYEYEGPVSNAAGGNSGNYTIDYKDIPLTTARELMIYGDNNIGVSNNNDKGNYIFSNDMILPTTNRETQSTNNPLLGATSEIKYVKARDENDTAKMTLRPGTNHNIITNTRGEEKQSRVYNEDPAKMTFRPGTNHNLVSNTRGEEKLTRVYNEDPAKMTFRPGTNYNIVSNTRGEEKQTRVYNEDPAKMTLRPGTNHNIITNTRGEEKQSRIYNEDPAKMTLRPGTNHNLISNTRGEEKQSRVYNDDPAKSTIKQTVLFMAPEKNVRGENELVYTSLQDDAKPTIKQTTIISNRQTGNISNALLAYTRDNEDKAKTTIRQQTESTKIIGHASDINHESRYVRDIDEIAKPTIRQQTESTKFIGHANDKNQESIYVRDLDEVAKPTIRQQTEKTKYIGHINSNNQESTYVKDKDYNAKPTIKQTTVYSTPAGRMNNSNMGNYTKDINDEARTTIKQTTLLKDYTGGIHGEIDGQISNQAANNMSIDDRREISTYNRTPNGKGDLNGPYIDAENVRYNDKKEVFSYVSNPHRPLDHSVMPTTSKETIEKVYSMSKPIIETSSYYVNPYFINTLKNNPLVNDIYHQKNV
jgi:2,3-bisphosphoglycerate-independent phosphoglycerate mutase